MKTNNRLRFAITFAAMMAAPVAFAQDTAAPQQTMPNGGMNSDMMGGDMPAMEGMQGMMGMMQMMQKMGPMMEACTEMMQAMAPDTASPEVDEG